MSIAERIEELLRERAREEALESVSIARRIEELLEEDDREEKDA